MARYGVAALWLTLFVLILPLCWVVDVLAWRAGMANWKIAERTMGEWVRSTPLRRPPVTLRLAIWAATLAFSLTRHNRLAFEQVKERTLAAITAARP